MADLPREDLLQKLHELAERQGRTVDDVLADFLAPYEDGESGTATNDDYPNPEDLPPGSLARLAAAGREMPPYPAPINVGRNADDLLSE